MNKDNNIECMDIKIYNNCTKGLDCEKCNYQSTFSSNISNKIIFNTNAKHYVPKSKQNLIKTAGELNETSKSSNVGNINSHANEQKIIFNLDAAEYIPRFAQKIQISEEDDNNNIDEDCVEEFELIMKDIIDNELMEEMGEEDSDEERWFPKFSKCECCKGFVYKCKGTACENLGMCYCKMSAECDEDDL